uniref:Tudor domain-containing protein n=1 Tax=Amblyomma parvum TaxID=251391 RepID=A0A023FVU7_AMBPA
MTVLNKFMHAVNEYCKRNDEGVEEAELGKVYASLYREDLTYYRAVLTSPDPLPSGEFQVRFVDFGNEHKAYLSELKNVDSLGDFVVRLPYQAVQCQLRNLTPDDGFHWSDRESAALLELIGPDNPELLIRVTAPATDSSAAVVELFKRDPQTRHLTCINTELAKGAPL